MARTRSVAMGIAMVAVVSLLAPGCQSTGVADTTGGNVIVLRFATIDSRADTNGQTVAPDVFMKALEQLSGGRIKTTLQTNFGDGVVTAETDIVKAIATGDLDGGWPSTRAFSRAGIRALEPLEAPLTLTSYAAQRALVTGPASRALLGTIDGSGVVGLGLAVGPLRRPWATMEALRDVQRWHGVTFRSFNSPVQEDTIRALGAIPVSTGTGFPILVRAGTLRGAEIDVAQYARNGYGNLLPWAISNVVLWPKVTVLSLSQKRYDSLTAEQRGWIRGAAKEAVQASVDYNYDEATLAGHLCAQGVRFVEMSAGQVTGLRLAVHPVLDALAHDPATAGTFVQVQKVAARFPSPETVRVPATCRKP